MLCKCPRSTRFFTSMPIDELSIVHQYVIAGWKVAPTGSRYICPRQFVRDDSDWDVMMLNESGMQGEDVPINTMGMHVSGTGSGNGGSFRVGYLNVIMLDGFYWQAWTEATEFAVQSVECWRSRDKRVELFKKMEEVVIHRGLDAIMANRGPSPVSPMIAALKAKVAARKQAQNAVFQMYAASTPKAMDSYWKKHFQ